jgi:L-lactate dehydrogenase complex protein LldG
MSSEVEIRELNNDPARRKAFLATIRSALGHDADKPSPKPESRPQRMEKLLRQVEAGSPQLVSRWMEKAAANGMTVKQAAGDSVVNAVMEFLQLYHCRTVMMNFSDQPVPSLEPQLRTAGYELHHWGDTDCWQQAFQCDASITDCRCAMADSGGFLVWSDPQFGRSTTLTTAVHIVLLPEQRILPDLIDAMPRILGDHQGTMPSYAVVINGPSKTADIEMKLVTGVHGPKYLCAIVIKS